MNVLLIIAACMAAFVVGVSALVGALFLTSVYFGRRPDEEARWR